MDNEKKDEENKEEKIKKIGLTKNQNKQIMWAVILMVSVLMVVILVPIIKVQLGKFVYAKLDWQKTKLGEIDYYSTRIPAGQPDEFGNYVGNFFINFRNDPRKLDEEINMKKTTTMPIFTRDKVVYISTGKMERNCHEGIVATLTLSGFLRQFALMNVSSAMGDKEIANETGFPYITCFNSPKNTVINVIEGNETRIIQTSPDCYTLEFKDCEVIEVSEKFILEIIKGYMKGFVKK